jgi:DNA-binding transcriptional ArsR family regulator
MFLDRCDVHGIHGDSVQEVRTRMLDPQEFAALADIFKLLGQTTRLRILYALSLRELCVCDIAALLGASQTAVSHQLVLLRNGRLVNARRDG